MQTDDNKVRASWKMGAKCQIYSNSKKKWFYGEVAQIFTDEEGEWLVVHYDKSRSKQVQRYSTDIRPDSDRHSTYAQPEELKRPAGNQPYPDSEKQLRTSWGKGDQVEIFINKHQEWYMGEVVDIIKDGEFEWLHCVWARTNGEAISDAFRQRFSTDVRPVQGDDDDSGSTSFLSSWMVDSTGANTRSSASPRSTSGSPKNKSKKSKSKKSKSKKSKSKKSKSKKNKSKNKSKAQQMADQLKQRNENFRRRAPPFSGTLRGLRGLRPSTFTFPATATAKRQRKLLDLEETNEKYQHVVDVMPRSNATVKRLDLGDPFF